MSWKPSKHKSPFFDWMPEWLRLTVNVGIWLGVILALVVIGIAGYYYNQARSYDLAEVGHANNVSVILDRMEHPLRSISDNDSSRIQADDLPQHLIDALVAREDASFFDHRGVHLKGLVRATVRNLKDMAFTQGGSTLTMQLARNTYDIKAKSLNRKFLEIALSVRIDSHFSKEEIMAHYLNRIYFGSGCHGIEQASQTYFSKATKDLDLSESALLVGIIRGPHIFSPLRDLDAAIEQRNQVLERMVSIGKLSRELADKTKLVKQKVRQKIENQRSKSSFAANAIQRHLNEIIANEDIRESTLQIHTTVDSAHLSRCQRDIDKLTNGKGDLQAACIIIDNQTGDILSLIGGVDYSASTFNRALDGKMDLGAAFTPFIYAAALERSHVPVKGRPDLTGKLISAKETIRIAKRFGFTSQFEPHSVYHGSAVASPLELATAFAVLGNKGKRPHTRFIRKITKADGTSLFSNPVDFSQAIETGNADTTLTLLNKNGGCYTHTVSAFKGRALWSMATTPELTALIWLGYDQPKPVPNSAALLKEMERVVCSWMH